MTDWRECERKAEHYKAIGQTEIYLDSGSPDIPWHLATKFEPGGSHRLEIYTSVCFRGTGESGLEYRWSFDLEPYQANGQGYYIVDTDGIRAALRMLPAPVAKQFAVYLRECAKAVDKKADEWESISKRQRRTASALNALAQEHGVSVG